ncbi:hypothetical protein DPX16_23751 [Anabarilius grahami]|uniref:Uncharacterized protein n=1 Tax=Anabarilius grahami TaxID=495550 RepID=A0A3N0YGP3_ANAGA|nr:hypothetical protein DPX16_23751 [Anabarilius grahami]
MFKLRQSAYTPHAPDAVRSLKAVGHSGVLEMTGPTTIDNHEHLRSIPGPGHSTSPHAHQFTHASITSEHFRIFHSPLLPTVLLLLFVFQVTPSSTLGQLEISSPEPSVASSTSRQQSR